MNLFESMLSENRKFSKNKKRLKESALKEMSRNKLDALEFLYNNDFFDIVYDRRGKEITDIRYSMDEVEDYIDSGILSEEDVKSFADYLYNIKFYSEDGRKSFIELSDHHTLWDVENPDIDDYQYAEIVDKYGDEFEVETGVSPYLLGRMGRHVCVEDNFDNILNYDYLREVQQRLEQEMIDEINSSYVVEENKKKKVKESTPMISREEVFAYLNDAGLEDYYENINLIVNEFDLSEKMAEKIVSEWSKKNHGYEDGLKKKIKESSFISDEDLSTYDHKNSPDYEENELYELDPVDSDFEKLNDTPIEIEYVEDEHDPERDFQASFWWDGQRQYLDDIVRVHNNPWFSQYDNYPAYIHGISDDYMHPFFVEIVDGGDAVNIYREKHRRTESKKVVKESYDAEYITRDLVDKSGIKSLENAYERNNLSIVKKDSGWWTEKCPTKLFNTVYNAMKKYYPELKFFDDRTLLWDLDENKKKVKESYDKLSPQEIGYLTRLYGYEYGLSLKDAQKQVKSMSPEKQCELYTILKQGFEDQAKKSFYTEGKKVNLLKEHIEKIYAGWNLQDYVSLWYDTRKGIYLISVNDSKVIPINKVRSSNSYKD